MRGLSKTARWDLWYVRNDIKVFYWRVCEYIRLFLVAIHDIAQTCFFLVRAKAIDAWTARKPIPRPSSSHDIYRTLIASGQYTWRQFGTRRKSRQAARRAAQIAWGNWDYCWRNYIRHVAPKEATSHA